MFVEERHQYIVEMVNLNGNVRVKELSEKFNVTEDCIRKDLAVLEKKGFLKRAYGGAVTVRENVHKRKSSERRKSLHIEERREIAKKAVKLLRKHDFVYLDVSTTSIEIAQQLAHADISLSVLTNMIEVLNVLKDAKHIQLIFLGGTINEERDAFWGSMSKNILSSFRVDIAFLGVVGVNPYDGKVSTYVVEDGYMKQEVLAVSKNTYLLCESNKFKTDGNYVYASLNDVKGMIVGMALDKQIKDNVKEYNLEIV
ncbi:DeoR/GlpR family transcriptional regulator of sugar metabolism [Breznakia sp. PF5-3]|uniref:DeoR/GlpR family DNA-binding transcription regulator n=1 Tax=unclassified Breznakia TaxID=2623764 RepID=UPI002406FD98|nr:MULTISPECIES: DeoR/GlpR family DNA-binding transcription regulator [unclassified Breznakia]MDF9824216.1 DeoR/GlpR family transcriptional regulator of sugar metabolism [Breznakia sp. PM6-1]MDF9835014.1 DeoR/GlpR family transcriptional regulator of sugar metabolism [Breznakia sp. PF5-3]MDF9837259.1 DeoR/GlpR family transcriptional regulator of sugar metabolism [Breznakia sp. PFB2-8]MDF9859249.1 DeoR/GlpR family transcriptional regulator of sugar metabolism [Breznakia sp. PH5-24]